MSEWMPNDKHKILYKKKSMLDTIKLERGFLFPKKIPDNKISSHLG